MSWVKHGLPCPMEGCNSSDGFALDDQGTGRCFACNQHYSGDTSSMEAAAPKTTKAAGLLHGDYQPLLKRGLTVETCRKYGILLTNYSGDHAVAFNYQDAAGNTVAQHVRINSAKNKMRWVGDHSKVGLFGKHLWPAGGKNLVITEGEFDCATVSQVQDHRWSTVSIMNGAQSAVKDIQADLEYVESFEKVVLMFDMDSAGIEAAEGVAQILTPGKCYIAKLTHNDANAALMAGDPGSIITAKLSAGPYMPNDIVMAEEALEAAITPLKQGMEWPWPELTRLTYGIRPGELYGWGAGTAVGKSEVFSEIIFDQIFRQDNRIGLLSAEQPIGETVKRVAGKIAGNTYHIPDGTWDQGDLEKDARAVTDTNNLVLYRGTFEAETILSKINFMVQANECRIILLDHVTAIAAGERDERKGLDSLMSALALQANRLGHALVYVSHLNTPMGTPHEEGGEVNINHFRGSRAMGYWSDFIFGQQRDCKTTVGEDKLFSKIIALKDRLSGRSTGESVWLKYNPATGRLAATVERPTYENAQIGQSPERREDEPF